MKAENWLVTCCFAILGCASLQSSLTYTAFEGQTMGTYYRVVAGMSEQANLSVEQIDSKLVRINDAVSTYIENSLISQFNHAADTIFALDEWDPELVSFFEINFNVAKDVYGISEGYFDPTVLPLVEYWGFGSRGRDPAFQPDSAVVDSLASLVGFDMIQMKGSEGERVLIKSKPGIELDFSAVAKGFAVDALAELMESQQITNYLIDIGGEVRCRGVNRLGNTWVIGINTPAETASLQDVELSVTVKNRSVATSGNYRNFYELNGQKYSHTINPMTGFPERNQLLSVSIFTESCTLADAMATACMSMGLDRSRAMIGKQKKVEAVFIYADDSGKLTYEATPGIRSLIKE